MCRLFAVLAHAVLAIGAMAGDLVRPPLTVRAELVATQTLEHQLLGVDVGEEARDRVRVLPQLLMVRIVHLVVHHAQLRQSVRDALLVEVQMEEHHFQFEFAVLTLEVVDLLLQSHQRVGQRRYHDAKRWIGYDEQLGRSGQELVQIALVFVLFEEKVVGHVEAEVLLAAVELQVPGVDVQQEALCTVAFGVDGEPLVNARTADAEHVRELASDDGLQNHLQALVREEVLRLLLLVHVRRDQLGRQPELPHGQVLFDEMVFVLFEFVGQHQQRAVHAPSSLGSIQFHGLDETALKVLPLLVVPLLKSL